MRAAALLVASAALAGCALGPPAPADPSPRPPPIAAYAANPFVPVNLYLNANEQLAPRPAALVEYAARRLADSKAFVRVDRGVQRWPITIQASYRQADADSVADRWRRVAGVLTLGLVPVRVARTHTLFVEVFEEPEGVAALELATTRADRVSFYDFADDADRDGRAAVDELLDRLLAEIATRKLVPRWSAFRPEPHEKPRPPKVPGRET